MSPRNSPEMVAVALLIQSTIVVTIATATTEAMPAMASAPRPEMVFSPYWMVRNTATVIATAAATPNHTHLMASRRSDLTRKARRMVTTIAASRPSRRPIKALPNSCEDTLAPAAKTDSGTDSDVDTDKAPTAVIRLSFPIPRFG
jgi:hypothetical protein